VPVRRRRLTVDENVHSLITAADSRQELRLLADFKVLALPVPNRLSAPVWRPAAAMVRSTACRRPRNARVGVRHIDRAHRRHLRARAASELNMAGDHHVVRILALLDAEVRDDVVLEHASHWNVRG